MNDSLKCVENFIQLISIKVNAIPPQGEEGARFEIAELLERDNEEEVTTIIRKKTIFFETDKKVDFRDVIPKLTFSPNTPHIKYLRFFTMPYLN